MALLAVSTCAVIVFANSCSTAKIFFYWSFGFSKKLPLACMFRVIVVSKAVDAKNIYILLSVFADADWLTVISPYETLFSPKRIKEPAQHSRNFGTLKIFWGDQGYAAAESCGTDVVWDFLYSTKKNCWCLPQTSNYWNKNFWQKLTENYIERVSTMEIVFLNGCERLFSGWNKSFTPQFQERCFM